MATLLKIATIQNNNDADLIQQPLDGDTCVQSEQPLRGNSSDQPIGGNERVQVEQPLEVPARRLYRRC
jgi:hypothetical protein